MTQMPFVYMTDFYKTTHLNCYKPGTSELTFYWTARNSRIQEVEDTTFFGLQAFIKEYLIDEFNNFGYYAIDGYKDFLNNAMGVDNSSNAHFEKLRDLGYLPIEINAVDEGTRVPIGVPMLEIRNTHPDFYWLPGYIETLMSCNLWLPITSATTARRYYTNLRKFYQETGLEPNNVPYAVTDFSMRGMTSLESAKHNGGAHLLYFNKTANIPSLFWLSEYYGMQNGEMKNAGTTSTEHSVMCSYEQDELTAFKTILAKYPNGNISLVSDTYNLWTVINTVFTKLKFDILNRNGTVLCRPDSGNPIDIVAGRTKAQNIITPDDASAYQGVVSLLWDIFGGTVNEAGYKVLDPHIRVVYGDAITLDRCNEICTRLMLKGFAPNNVIFGIGSYTYQYVTRDTYSQALKATHAVINGKEVMLYKDPITDENKIKKSQKGLCAVIRGEDGKIKYLDGLTHDAQKDIKGNLLTPVFKNGKLLKDVTIKELRERVR